MPTEQRVPAVCPGQESGREWPGRHNLDCVSETSSFRSRSRTAGLGPNDASKAKSRRYRALRRPARLLCEHPWLCRPHHHGHRYHQRLRTGHRHNPEVGIKRVQAQHRLGGAFGDHGVDELRAVRGDMGERRGALGTEVVEEPAQGLASCGPCRPTPAGRCRGRSRPAGTAGPSCRRSRRSRSGAAPPAGRSPRRGRPRRGSRCPTPSATRCAPAPPPPTGWRGRPATPAVSSNAVVNRDPARAHGTAATTTPWLGHDTRRVVACRNTGVVPMSRPRQRRGSLLTS